MVVEAMVIEAMAWSRVAVGAGATLAPDSAARALGRGGPTSARERLVMRTAGARDLVIGVGILRAASRGEHLPAWVAAGAACDAADAAAAVVGGRELGRRRWLVVVAAASAALVGAVLALTEE